MSNDDELTPAEEAYFEGRMDGRAGESNLSDLFPTDECRRRYNVGYREGQRERRGGSGE